MTAPLYTTEILRLASAIPHLGRLEHADGSAQLRAPLCGSRVHVDVKMADGVLNALGLEVNSCALGQASAALLGASAPGRSADEVDAATRALTDLLEGRGEDADFWPGIAVLARARDYPARHGAILLPFRALTQAMRAAGGIGLRP